MKPMLFQALACTLLLVGCNPGSLQTVPAKQTDLTQSSQHSGSESPEQANQNNPDAGSAARDKISVKVNLPQSAVAAKNQAFGIKSALPAQAAYVRLTIKAVDFNREYHNNGGITLNGFSNLVAIVGTSAVLTVDQLPKGKNRLVIAQVYDADGRELTSFRAMGLFHSQTLTPSGSLRFGDENTQTDTIEQSVTRRNLPLLSMLEQAIDAKNTAFLNSVETHLDQLATEFDKMVYGPNTPGTTFNVDPQRIDPAEVYADLNNKIQTQAINLDTGLPAYFQSQAPAFTDPLSNVTVYLATPNGFNFTQNLTVQIDDPSSAIVSVTSTGQASPVSASLNNITRGSRRLTVFGPTGQLLGHTTVVIDPDSGITFANGAGSAVGQPLVLLGSETGVAISSISQASAVQATPLTLNGVGFSPTLADNVVKFGTQVAPITGSTTSTINLATPNLIGGTYPVTVTRLGVVSNFQNFALRPAITSLSAGNGSVGSSLTLTGTGFDPIAANNTVTIGGVPATVTAATASSLTVTVPTVSGSGLNVLVSVGGQTNTGSHLFTVGPAVTSLSPVTGPVGTSITITGTGFDPNPANNTVLFGGVPATVTAATSTSLTVTVPVTAGTNDVTVTVAGATNTGTHNYQVTPTVSSLSAANGTVGSSLTITGTGFSTTPANNAVQIGGVTASVTAATATSLTVTVPSLTGSGHNVVVTVGSLANSGTNNFQITPAITSLGSSSGQVFSSVTINGTGFSSTAANNTVSFGATAATVTAATATSLTVTVPANLSGAQNITVTVAGQTNSGTNTFEVVPTILSLSPASGNTGIAMTINGRGFSIAAANNTVKFGLVSATVNSASPTTLQVTVPGGISGNVAVTVMVGNQTSSSSNYQVLIPPVITSLSPASGCPGTTVLINGSNFGSSFGQNWVNWAFSTSLPSSDSPTQLAFTAPGGSGPTDVQVTSNGLNSNIVTFTYGGAPIYVDASASGANNGSSWANAYTSLQSALAASSCAGTEIWVKAGTYKPGALRTNTFQLTTVPVYGGFNGTETLRSQRNWSNNPTILSGDINGDDNYSTVPATNIADNSYHVVKGASSAVLDGFVIQGGHANSTNPDNQGAGFFQTASGALTLKNLVLQNNAAISHPAMHLVSVNSTAENLIFTRNTNNGIGGGTTDLGGNINIQNGTHTWSNVLMTGNITECRGGGIHMTGAPIMNLNQLTITGNTETQGCGSPAMFTSGTVNLNNSIIYNNATPDTSCREIDNAATTFNMYNTTIGEYSTSAICRTAPTAAVNIIETNPNFINTSSPQGADGKLFTSDDGFALSAGSPAINTGDNTKVPGGLLTDITSSANRILNTTVDRGAYEMP